MSNFVQKIGQKFNQIPFIYSWIILSILGYTFASFTYLPGYLLLALFGVIGFFFMGAFFGGVLGFFQTYALNKRGNFKRKWLYANLYGYGVGAFAGFSIGFNYFSSYGLIDFILIIAICVSLAEFFVFRSHLNRIGIWILNNIISTITIGWILEFNDKTKPDYALILFLSAFVASRIIIPGFLLQANLKQETSE